MILRVILNARIHNGVSWPFECLFTLKVNSHTRPRSAWFSSRILFFITFFKYVACSISEACPSLSHFLCVSKRRLPPLSFSSLGSRTFLRGRPLPHSRPSSLRPSRPSFGTASTRPIFSFTESFHLVTSQTLFSAWCTSSFLIFTCERLPTMGGQNFNYSSRPLASLPILLVDAHSSSSHYSSTLAHPFLALVHQCFPHLMHYITTV